MLALDWCEETFPAKLAGNADRQTDRQIDNRQTTDRHTEAETERKRQDEQGQRR